MDDYARKLYCRMNDIDYFDYDDDEFISTTSTDWDDFDPYDNVFLD